MVTAVDVPCRNCVLSLCSRCALAVLSLRCAVLCDFRRLLALLPKVAVETRLISRCRAHFAFPFPPAVGVLDSLCPSLPLSLRASKAGAATTRRAARPRLAPSPSQAASPAQPSKDAAALFHSCKAHNLVTLVAPSLVAKYVEEQLPATVPPVPQVPYDRSLLTSERASAWLAGSFQDADKKDGRREIEPRRPSFLFFRSCVALSRCSERDFFPFFISLVSFATQAVHDLLRLASLESGLKVHDGATPCRAGRPAASPKALTASPSLLASVPVVTRT